MFIDLNTIQRQHDDDGDTLFFDMKEIVFFATLPAKKKEEEEEEWMLRVHVSFSLFVKSYCVRVGG